MTEAEQFSRVDPIIRVPIKDFEPGHREFGLGMSEQGRMLLEGVAEYQNTSGSLGEAEEEDYERLWESMLEAFDRLENEGLIEGSWEQWNGHELCEAIIQLTANGMRYVWLPLSEALKTDPLSTTETGRFASNVKAFELFFVSFVKTATLDLRDSVWLAERPIQKELSGLCRHYARIVRVLFFTAQRVTGRWSDWDVLEITGRVRFQSRWLHVWNWLIDHRRGVIYSFDVTWADYQLDKGKTDSIFNDRLAAATLHNNRSAFLSMLFHGVGMGAYEDDFLETIGACAPGMLELEWIEEHHILHHVLYHGGLHAEVIDEITQRLLAFFNLPADTDLEVVPGPLAWVLDAPAQLSFLDLIVGSEDAQAETIQLLGRLPA